MKNNPSGGGLLVVLLAAACAPGEDDPARDVPGDLGAEGDETDVPTGALIPAAPPVEVHLTRDFDMGPVLLTALSGSAVLIWGEKRPTGGDWAAPGMAMIAGDGTVATEVLHLAVDGHEPIDLEPHIGLNQLAYFTVERGAGCAAFLRRSMVDTLGRLMGPTVAVDDLDDPVALHVASQSGSALVMAVEGNACTARTYPAVRMIVVGADGRATGSVPLGDAQRISGITDRPGSVGYLSIRFTEDVGVRLDTIRPGGGVDRSWTIVRRDGTCACPSSQAMLATTAERYLAAWAGEVDRVQSWFLHLGPYFDDLGYGDDPAVIPLAAQFDRRVAVAAFGGDWVVAYVPSDGSAPLRVDLLRDDGTLDAGWAPEVPGTVRDVAIAAIGSRVAVAWIEVWAGAAAPNILRAALFRRNDG